MKHTKNLLLVLLAGLLAASSTLVSCSTGETNSQTVSEDIGQTALTEETASNTETETETETEEYLLEDGLEDQDFEGYEFRIASFFENGGDLAHYAFYDEYTGNPVHDALTETTYKVNERFNVKISSVSVDFDSLQSLVRAAIQAGDDAFDIQLNHDLSSFNMAKEGLFYNLYEVEQFDFTQPWWPSEAVNSLAIGKSFYCASNYLTYIGLHYTRAVIVNKDFANDLNREIPYDLVREGGWTLDAMIAYTNDAAQDLDGDGIYSLKNDMFGFTTGPETLYCLQEGLGLSAYQRDENGIPFFGMDLDKLTTIIEKWRAFYNSNGHIQTKHGDTVEPFIEERALLNYALIGDAYDLYRDVEMSYGFLPTPKADELQENYINCCTDRVWAIPKTAKSKQIEIIGTICEALACLNYQKVLPAYYEVAMKSRVADSPDDAEMLQIIADTRTIGFAYNYGLKFSKLISDLQRTTNEPASLMAAGEKSATKDLNKLLEKFLEFEK